MASDSSLVDFYKDAVILITGGTGFLGKCLVEKLLRSFPDVKHIYMLVRSKRGISAESRMDDYFNQSIFTRIKAESPGRIGKVTGICGDLTSFRLGVSPRDEEKILEEVNIIFHVAATVKFTEPMRTAVAINVRGTQTVLDLAREMPKMKSFVHVSTAYSNCLEKYIKEEVYNPPISYKKIYQLVDCLDDVSLDRITTSLLEGWPNTYTFTKCIAESMVLEYKENGLAVGIFRPAIIIPTYQDPFPGWVDNYSGTTGVMVGASRGYIRCMPGNYKVKPNLVPADLCTNIMITTAWDISRRFHNKNETHLPIYNYVGKENLISWGKYTNQICPLGLDHPFEDAMWQYSMTIFKTDFGYNTAIFFFHLLPALFIDGIATIIGKKVGLYNTYKKIHSMVAVLKYFGMNKWDFETANCEQLWDKLNTKEKSLVPFSMKQFDWIIFGKHFIPGVQKYLMKQSSKSLAQARTRAQKLHVLHHIVKFIMPFFVMFLIWGMLRRK